MITMVVISVVAVLVAVVGSALIWGFDRFRAEEIAAPYTSEPRHHG
jgi:hypothetical protein